MHHGSAFCGLFIFRQLTFDVVAALGDNGLAEFGGEFGCAGDSVDTAGFALTQGALEVLFQRARHARHEVVSEVDEVDVE